MPLTLAFDIYGTLIDTQGLVTELSEMIGNRAPALSARWRDKQLEYSFRRALMQRYVTFAECTAQALDFCCTEANIQLTQAERERLLEGYTRLPAFADALPALTRLRAAGHATYAFSNGTRSAVEGLLQSAGLRELFIDVVSVDELRSFKPDPAVYAHFLRVADCKQAAAAWLISGNPFDVIGAKSAGMHAAWVRRRPEQPFDPWDLEPDLILGDLIQLTDRFAASD